ncbi:hypothetical protein EDD22DRAFT_845917 [Suillus occidentalis]|nr:hypothetical protein EDD22DRAFT_845917 [Suillus occidentalis]
MASESPSHRSKNTAVHSRRYNPYGRTSRDANASITPCTAPLTRRFALHFNDYEVQLEQDIVWMGSAMSIDEPTLPGRTPGSAQDVSIPSVESAGDDCSKTNNVALVLRRNSMASVANHIGNSAAVGYLSPKKVKLMRSLQKVVGKQINHHCKRGHPTTDLLRERINAALVDALMGIDVDDIVTRKPKTNNDGQDIQYKLRTTNEDIIIPVGRYIVDQMKRTLFSLGTVLSAKSEPLEVSYSPGIPGGYPTAYKSVRR